MNRITLTVCLLFGLFFNIQSQDFPSEMWHKGQAELMSGEKINGKIKYDLDNNLIQIDIGSAIKTYSSRNILKFDLFDEIVKGKRHFFALPYSIRSDYKVPIIFEVLFEGKLTLLCREEIVQESASNFDPYYSYYNRYDPYNYNQRTRQRLAYNYYFVDEKGNIQSYNQKKNSLYAFFKVKQSEMKQYIKKNRLKYDKMSDLVRITAYYNALIE